MTTEINHLEKKKVFEGRGSELRVGSVNTDLNGLNDGTRRGNKGELKGWEVVASDLEL